MIEDQRFTNIKRNWPFSGSAMAQDTYNSAEIFYNLLAREVMHTSKPEKVLDFGCSSGQLVVQLRSLGIQADGFEFAGASWDNLLPGARRYCKVIESGFPINHRYDLIICMESLPYIETDQIQQALKAICEHTDAILFSSNPYSDRESGAPAVQSPGRWAELFAANGFIRNPAKDFSSIIPWGMYLHRVNQLSPEMIGVYENQLWQQRYESLARRELGISLQKDLSSPQQGQEVVNILMMEKAQLTHERDQIFHHYMAVINSRSWRFMRSLQAIRHRLIPLGSRRERWMYSIFTFILHPFAGRGKSVKIEPIHRRPAVETRSASVDVIICIHNALHDVRNCLSSVARHSSPPYRIILVDDGSDEETAAYLNEFISNQECLLLRNDTARGYTFAANQGLRASTADFALLINSDTIVTPGWLDKMVACAQSDPKIGMVGPLSNTASWQSIPKIESNGDWADNPLPPDLTIDQMGELVTQYSERIYPTMMFLNGFCLLICRDLIAKIGFFDEEHFGVGYGEENDYCLRARKAGWKLALADDVYIYHAQSKSYSTERRKKLSDLAAKTLVEKHGQKIVDEGVNYSLTSRTLIGIRARSMHYYAQWDLLNQGRRYFSGRRVLFILPVKFAGGGSNVVISEARAMLDMGVDVGIFNLETNRNEFTSSNPLIEVPVMYGDIRDIPQLAASYDAVIATFNTTVAWMAPARSQNKDLVFGYYVQDFEPMFYPEGSSEYSRAFESYSLIPGMHLFCKTEWVRNQLLNQVGLPAANVGVSINTQVYRPRPRHVLQSIPSQLKIGAMVRPESKYRAPELTMQVLKKADQIYGMKILPLIFGMNIHHQAFNELSTDFRWKSAGLLTPRQVAAFMNELDIFVDFSTHQAMGLSALEAMACGAAVILPEKGGTADFAQHEINSLVIDTSEVENCWEALKTLIENSELRNRLILNGTQSVCKYYPEKSAYNILNTLFPVYKE